MQSACRAAVAPDPIGKTPLRRAPLPARRLVPAMRDRGGAESTHGNPQCCGGERMKYPGRIGSAAALAATALAAVTVLAGPASAATGRGASFGGASHVVFVQTDNTAGNQVVAYRRAADGTLSFAAAYHTV